MVASEGGGIRTMKWQAGAKQDAPPQPVVGGEEFLGAVPRVHGDTGVLQAAQGKQGPNNTKHVNGHFTPLRDLNGVTISFV